MDINGVHGNNSWKFHDHTKMGTWWKWCDGQTDGQTDGWMDGQNQLYNCLVAAKNKWHAIKDRTFTGHAIFTQLYNMYIIRYSLKIHYGISTKCYIQNSWVDIIFKISRKWLTFYAHFLVQNKKKAFLKNLTLKFKAGHKCLCANILIKLCIIRFCWTFQVKHIELQHILSHRFYETICNYTSRLPLCVIKVSVWAIRINRSWAQQRIYPEMLYHTYAMTCLGTR